MRMVSLVGAVAILVAAGGNGFAETPYPPAGDKAFRERFSEMDADGDGRISRDEYVQHEIKKGNERFDAGDTNRDGYMSREEAEQAARKNRERIRQQMLEWQKKQQRRPSKP